MRYLTKQALVSMHEIAVRDFGGESGIRDDSLLESSLAAPLASFGGADLFTSVIEKAARLAFGIIKNHPFIDGNIRKIHIFRGAKWKIYAGYSGLRIIKKPCCIYRR
jgi:death-on-curing protein